MSKLEARIRELVNPIELNLSVQPFQKQGNTIKLHIFVASAMLTRHLAIMYSLNTGPMRTLETKLDLMPLD